MPRISRAFDHELFKEGVTIHSEISELHQSKAASAQDRGDDRHVCTAHRVPSSEDVQHSVKGVAEHVGVDHSTGVEDQSRTNVPVEAQVREPGLAQGVPPAPNEKIQSQIKKMILTEKVRVSSSGKDQFATQFYFTSNNLIHTDTIRAGGMQDVWR